MRVRRRVDTAGVSEILGTILILAMTVVLFSGIIIWISTFPAPSARMRSDVLSRMDATLDSNGIEVGVNITLTHAGGTALESFRTLLYVTSQRGTEPARTDVVALQLYNGLLASPNGLIDGSDTVWDIGERWTYRDQILRTSDSITVTIVDTIRSTIIWTGSMNAPEGLRPPVFVDKWADGSLATDSIDPVYAGAGFYLFAKVADPDGDLNPASVYAILTAWYGSGTLCELPLQMRDDGVFPDAVAGDQIFSLGGISCTNPPFPALSWSGTIILLNASDFQGRETATRFVLEVVPPPGGSSLQTIPSQLWQYIGFVQIRAGEVWVSNLNNPYDTTVTYQPFRITRSELNGNGGALFHLQMENHGNRTIFIDGWTAMIFSSSARANTFGLYIVRPVSPTLPANGGGLAAYPGTASDPDDFQYAQVFDINPLDQETGGTPVVVRCAAQTPFRSDWPRNFPQAESLFVHILVSGMAGPVNMTYQQILDRWGPTYNPIDHLDDADPATRTFWYAQVIPFIGMTVY